MVAGGVSGLVISGIRVIISYKLVRIDFGREMPYHLHSYESY